MGVLGFVRSPSMLLLVTTVAVPLLRRKETAQGPACSFSGDPRAQYT